MAAWFACSSSLVLLLLAVVPRVPAEEYLGYYLGKLNTYQHQVSGSVYAVDEYTLIIRNFVYDGLGQDTFFWAGSTVRPSNVGFIVPDETGKTNKLLKYENRDVALKMPDNKKITTIKWLAIWDVRDMANYGDITVPEGFSPPAPQKLSEFSRKAHGVKSGPVLVVDSRTVHIPKFNFDGESPDTYFWVGNGPEPNAFGQKVMNEGGYINPLGRYENQDVTLELPGNLTVFDISWLAVWSEGRAVSFGSVMIPEGLNIPPSLLITAKFDSTLPNCEQLHKNLQVSWEIFGSQITFTLAGQIEEDEYMAFGISGSTNSSQMMGSDVAVSYIDGYLGVTVDYNITGRYPCTNILGPRQGVCPDTLVGGVDNFQFQTFHREDGITSITYRRDPTNAGDSGDKIYKKEGVTYIVWAIGKYDKYRQPGFHHTYPKGDVKLELGRKLARKNCHPFTRPPAKEKIETWGPFQVKDRKVQRFTVRLGPPGLWKGDLGLKDRAGPGLVYYVNGLMTPDLYVKRGRQYEYRVECGASPHNTRFYHPFYLTDDPMGGYHHYSNKEREDVKIFAGIDFDEKRRPSPTTLGHMCAFMSTNRTDLRKADSFLTFAKFRSSLELVCESDGSPAVFQWTPNISTPDLLYYQSYTQRNMGGRIIVLDEIPSGVPGLNSSIWTIITTVAALISTTILRT